MLLGLILNMSGPWGVVNRYTCGYEDLTRNAVLLNSGDINRSENQKIKFI